MSGSMKKAWLLVLLLVFFPLGGCEKPPQRPLKVASIQWLGYEPLYLARYLNAFHDGIDIVQFPSNSDVLRAFRNGNLDVAAVTLDEALLLMSQGEDLVVPMALDFSNGADVVLGWPPVTHLQDIRGKVVGAENTALGAMMLSAALEHVGLSVSDITLRNVPLDQHYEQFTKHKLDAIVTFEPISTQLRDKGAVVLFDSSAVPDLIVDVLVVRRSVLQFRSAQIQDLVRGYFIARDFMNEHPDEAYAYISRRVKMSSGQLVKAFQGLRLPSINDNIRWMSGNPSAFDTNLKRLYQLMLKRKLLKPVSSLHLQADPSWLQRLNP